MIRRIAQGREKEYDSLFDALQMDKSRQEVVSVTGGGGKTTLIRRLQQECMGLQISHAVSTTTHMQYERNAAFLEEESLERLLAVENKERTVWMGRPVSEEKMQGFSAVFLEKVYKQGLWLLLEADGAKYLPVKAPAAHEPVIVPFTTRVVQVYGLDGIGYPIKDVCFRPDCVSAVLGKSPAEILTSADIVRLAASTQGGRKQVAEGMRYQVVLNKADDRKRQKLAEEIVNALKESGIEDIVITAELWQSRREI